ncbi:phenylpyruvate tautomerase MIF-related protein [Thiohalophilus sp.]|uniref:phenylpyruvate tautomerase MIF-related protein n=1 Tax=Thiohalophilus sp. TaxID=3028392 RepID=UPI0039748E71
MPLLKIQSNQAVEPARAEQLVTAASALVAGQLGKPERYVMVVLEPPTPMSFGGSTAPLAYLELKSIGLPQDKTPALSEALCGLILEQLGIDPDRVYIEFADAPRAMWGWNKTTF